MSDAAYCINFFQKNVIFFITIQNKFVSLHQQKNKTHTIMKIQEIYNELVKQIADNASVRHGNGYCTWVISGRYTDSDGDSREVNSTTHDEELATGWKEDVYDKNLYNQYQRKWAEFLIDELDLVNAY